MRTRTVEESMHVVFDENPTWEQSTEDDGILNLPKPPSSSPPKETPASDPKKEDELSDGAVVPQGHLERVFPRKKYSNVTETSLYYTQLWRQGSTFMNLLHTK